MHQTNIDIAIDKTHLTLFELRAIHYHYPDGHCGLAGIDLDIFAGDRLALVGQNGAGKTTLAKHLNGLLPVQSGSLQYRGKSLKGNAVNEARKKVGILFQDPDDHLFNNTIYDDVAFGLMNLEFSQEDVDARVRKVLHQVGLEDLMFKPPHLLSYGQKKRAAFAAVLAMEPEVLILDEPTANLDPRQESVFSELLQEYSGTLICISHDLLFLYNLCERAVVLAGGSIHHDFSFKQLVSHRPSLKEHGLDFTFRFSCCGDNEHHHSQGERFMVHGSEEDLAEHKSRANNLLELSSFSYRYPDGTIGLSDINLSLHNGERVAIVGENGAGKSTLASCLIGVKQGEGKYRFKGKDVSARHARKLWRHIGIVFQDSADQLFCPSVSEEVAFGPRQMGLPQNEIERRVATSLDLVRLSGYEKRVPQNMSGGERKRLAIAAVLAMEPELLILDEPTASLDPQNEEILLSILNNLEITQILISHDIFFVSNSTTRTVVMHQGQAIRDYKTFEFLADDHLVSFNRLDYTYKNACCQEIMVMQGNNIE